MRSVLSSGGWSISNTPPRMGTGIGSAPRAGSNRDVRGGDEPPRTTCRDLEWADANERASRRRSARRARRVARVAGSQFALEDLARAGRGQRVDEFDRPRRLVTGDAPPGVLA